MPDPREPHPPPLPANAAIAAAWDGRLHDRFVRFRATIREGAQAHGDAVLARHPPRPGQRVLDIGCGFGDLTQQLAALVAPGGEAVGLDVSPRFVRRAGEEAARAGVENVRFRVADVQAGALGGPYDHAYSRFGTMFFADPVAAFGHVRGALSPGGTLAMVVWRAREDNPWIAAPQDLIAKILGTPAGAPPGAPDAFALADPATVTAALRRAGFDEVALERLDAPMRCGRDLDEAVEMALAMGPTDELLAAAGDDATRRREEARTALRACFAAFDTPDGPAAPSSSWIVTAR